MASLTIIVPSNAAVVQAAWHLIKKGLKLGKLALRTLLGCSSSQATSTAPVPSTSAPEVDVVPASTAAPTPTPALAPAPAPAPAPAAEPELVLAAEGPAALQEEEEEALTPEDIQKIVLQLQGYKVSPKKKAQLEAVICEALQTLKETSNDEIDQEPEKSSSFSFSSLWGTARRVWDNVTWAVGVACTIVSWVIFLTQLASQLAVVMGAFYAYYKAAHIVHLILLHL